MLFGGTENYGIAL